MFAIQFLLVSRLLLDWWSLPMLMCVANINFNFETFSIEKFFNRKRTNWIWNQSTSPWIAHQESLKFLYGPHLKYKKNPQNYLTPTWIGCHLCFEHWCSTVQGVVFPTFSSFNLNGLENFLGNFHWISNLNFSFLQMLFNLWAGFPSATAWNSTFL